MLQVYSVSDIEKKRFIVFFYLIEETKSNSDSTFIEVENENITQ